jgi:hypothetical protein
MKRYLTVAALVAVAGFVLLGRRAAPSRIEYRPGVWFPKGFPLHGEVKLLSAPVVEMGKKERVRIQYTVGDIALEPGLAVEIWKHFTSDVEEFLPRLEFLRPGVEADVVKFEEFGVGRNPDVFPYRRCARATIRRGRLEKGDRVVLDLGDVRMQHYQENLFNFRVVLTREGKVAGYAGDAMMKVTGGPLAKLRVQAPSVVGLGETFTVAVLPQDAWGSRAKDGAGLKLVGARFRYDPELEHYLGEFQAEREGVMRVEVPTADGRFRASSNPVWVERKPALRVYYGDLHQHTYLHDGRGVFEELYQYGRRVGLLDFAAVSPHHMPMSVTGPNLHLPDGKRYPSENWPELQRVTKALNGWQGLVTILGYEYSVPTASGGHHNVFYNADEAPSVMQLDRENPMAPIGKMLQTLRLVQKPTLVIPHIGGGPPDWSHPTDPRIERLFEIASVHGVFEESWQAHLKAGLKLGASAAGDTHTTAMGNAYPGLVYTMTNALTGVWAKGRSRQDIWEGMYEQRTFAATGNTRMLVDLKGDGGRLRARASGTAPLVRVEVVKNGSVVHALRPARRAGTLLRVVWGDNLYQRRATAGLRSGELRTEGGRLRLIRSLHLDQAFERVEQDGPAVRWTTAAVSGDRDGFLVDVSEATGELRFRLDDSGTLGLMEVAVPRQEHFAWRKANPAVEHPYMRMMGVEPAFFLEVEQVNSEGPMDAAFEFQDREAGKPGDYYYLRVEQLDSNKAWSSPVWVR